MTDIRVGTAASRKLPQRRSEKYTNKNKAKQREEQSMK